MSKQSLYVAVS